MNVTFPQSLNLGDSLNAVYSLPPSPPDGDPWGSASLTFVRHSAIASERVAQVASPPPVINQDKIKIDISESDITSWGAGLWRWYLRLQSGAVIKTVQSGIINIINPVDGSITHERATLALLQEVLEEKLSGRRDIAQYMIGDRNVVTMSLDELKRMIDSYKERLRFRDNKRREWQSWK